MVDVAEVAGVGVLIAVTIVALIAVYAARYKKIPPDTAMVVYGRRFQGGKDFEVWTGGGRFIVPIVEAFKFISLRPIPFDVLIDDVVEDVRSAQPGRLQVSANGIARISDDPVVLRRAAGQLMHKSLEEVRDIAVMTVVGHVRGIVASEPFGVWESERAAEKVLASAQADLKNIGIELRSLFLKFRPAGPGMPRQAGPIEAINHELHSMESRLRRIEEKLGLTPPA